MSEKESWLVKWPLIVGTALFIVFALIVTLSALSG